MKKNMRISDDGHVNWAQAIEKNRSKEMQTSPDLRAIIVKLIHFALWTSVAIIHFYVRLGC